MSFCHVDFQATATTRALFDQVVKYLELTEKFFFGLTQLQGRMHFKILVEKIALINSKTVECWLIGLQINSSNAQARTF